MLLQDNRNIKTNTCPCYNFGIRSIILYVEKRSNIFLQKSIGGKGIDSLCKLFIEKNLCQ